MTELAKILNNPEEHYPGNFDTPQRANALLTGLCQDVAKEIAKLQAEVFEQCRINGMSAEREDSLRAELARLKASITLDKMAKNARELGLDYEPAPVQEPVAWRVKVETKLRDGSVDVGYQLRNERLSAHDEPLYTTPPAQPAVQEGRDWSLLEATQESLREHMAEIKRLKAAQPAPVKTYHDGKPWPVAPKPWVGLTDEDKEFIELTGGKSDVLLAELVEAKLKEKNHV